MKSHLEIFCDHFGFPSDDWICHSVKENPIRIYDRQGFKAIENRKNGIIAMYDLSVSSIHPVVAA